MKSLTSILLCACTLSIPISVNAEDTDGGYLFAHMLPTNYGRLYYSVSRDGLDWKTLNNGQIILSEYKGHPDLMQGDDGVWHMIGIRTFPPSHVPHPVHWHSQDLVHWEQENLSRDIFDISFMNRQNDGYFGAPKSFFDPATKQFIITWHGYDQECAKKGNNPLWESMKTLYITTKDFKTFSPIKPLFNFTAPEDKAATIDAIIRLVNGTYYAILKDERWPETIGTGKCIRIAKSLGGALGPYENPGPAICPAWHEAPSFVQSKDGKCRVYTEAYTQNGRYDMFEADTMAGPWTLKQYAPPKARHGCVVRINEKTYQGLLKAFDK